MEGESEMKARWLKQFALLPALALMASACASPPPKPQPAPSTPAPSSAAPSPPAAKTDAVVEITWLQWWRTELGDEPLNQVKAAFEKAHPNIKLKIEDLPYAQIHDKVIALDKAGAPPDVLTVQVPWNIEFAVAKITEPLNGYFEKEDAKFKDSVPGPLWVTWKGNYYGMPFYTGNVAMFYSTKALKDAGLEPPKTWAELETAARKLTNPGGNKFALTGNIGAEPPTTATYEIWPLLLQAGGKILDEKGEPAFNDEAGVEAVAFLKKLVNTYSTPGALSAGEKEKRANFSSQNTALMWEGPWGIGIQNKATNNTLDFKVAPLPKGKTHGTVVAGSLLAVAAKSQKKEAAWKFLRFMGDVEGQMIWAKAGNYFPHNKEAMKDDYVQKNPNMKVFADQFTQGNAICPDLLLPQAFDLRKIFMIEVQNAVSGKKTAKQALDDAAAQWKPILAKYK